MSAGPFAVKVEAFREEPAREHARPLLAPGPFVQALAAPKVEGQGVLSAGWLDWHTRTTQRAPLSDPHAQTWNSRTLLCKALARPLL